MLKRGLLLLALVLVLALCGAPLQGAGTVVLTKDIVSGAAGPVTRYSVAWTSTAGGAVSGNGFAIIPGRLISVFFIPGATTPSNNYDVTLTLSDGTFTTGDLLSNGGNNRSATVPSVSTFDPPMYQDGSRTLDVVVANAGASKTGTVVIYVQSF